MKTLAYHLLDIVQNALRAGASEVEISLVEDNPDNLLRLQVSDNGCGMDEKTSQKAIDPYYTSRHTRHVGLGLSLLKQNAERTGGTFALISRPNQGTLVKADFVKDHIDLPAIGDLPGTLHQIITAHPRKDFIYRHQLDETRFSLDTREVKEAVDHWPLDHPDIRGMVRELIDSCFQQLSQAQHPSVTGLN